MHGKLLAAIMAAGLCPLTAAAVTPDEFKIRNTQDLVRLCSVSNDDSLYVAAIHFCHGFGAGAYQYYQASVSGPEGKPFVCPPDPVPSRNAVLQEFVTWANANPQHNNEPAVESIFRFLAQKWPCSESPKPSKSAKSTTKSN